MITVYEQRGIEKGIYRGKQEALLRQMSLKFGPIPESIRTQIEKIADNAELDRLTDQILTAQTLAEMNLPEN